MKELTPDEVKQQYGEALELLRKHQLKQAIFRHSDTLAQRIGAVMEEYHQTATNALQAAKEFRDRMIIDLRAMSIVLTMVGNASTHKEKDARLRGTLEIVESAISRLERERFDIDCCNHPHFDDVFRSDYPTRHFVDRIRELQEQIKMLESALPTPRQQDLEEQNPV